MNKTEHLLVCLAEECAEIQQSVSKALRFGLENVSPTTFSTNREHILEEIIDVLAIIEMLIENGDIKNPLSEGFKEAVQEKKNKVEHFMVKAVSWGTLTENKKRCDSTLVKDIAITPDGRVGTCPRCGKFVKEAAIALNCHYCDSILDWEPKRGETNANA